METLTLQGLRVMHQMPTRTQQWTLVPHGPELTWYHEARCPPDPSPASTGRGDREARLPAAGLGEEEPLAG